MNNLENEMFNKLKEVITGDEKIAKKILQKYSSATDVKIEEINNDDDTYIKITDVYYEDDDNETPFYHIVRTQGYCDALLEVGADIIELYLTGAFELTNEELVTLKELVTMDGANAEEKLEKYDNILNRLNNRDSKK